MRRSRREFLILSSVACAAVPFRSLIAMQQPAAPVAGTFAAIRDDVGYFTGRGGTIGWLISSDAVVVVDTQFPDTAQICLDGVQKRSSGRGVDLVFNTHHHGDHTSGNGVFKPAARRIVAHAQVPELMKEGAPADAKAPAPAFPDTTFDATWSEKIGAETVSARHHGPGHTSGDAVIYFERANVAHMGDLLFRELHPFVDRRSGASIQNWMTTLERVVKEMPKDTLFIAGHARPDQPAVVQADALLGLRNYFDAVLGHVRKGIAEKKSRGEIAALAALPGFEQYQGAGQILSLQGVLAAAYEELTAA